MKPFEIDEQKHLEETFQKVRENIAEYEERVVKVRETVDELNDEITPRDRELNSQMSQQLTISAAMLDHISGMLRKNRLALDKPYFGRIDFEEPSAKREACLYIGKNGLQHNEDTLVVDWRAPAAKVYYENEIGKCSYTVPLPDGEEEETKINIDLVLKRTYDIENGKLNGYYDSDIAANDELLVKYLAQHKDVVLGDIIATIQHEQDEIIRQTPFRNTIVQGVAGSGKTTVALHRISHILYNYAHRYHSEDFCIIGSSDVLLTYIMSGLPDLDVDHVSQARMDMFFKELMEEDYHKDYHMIEIDPKDAWKCRLDFTMALDRSLSKVWHRLVKPRDIHDDKLGDIMTREHMYDMLIMRKDWSLVRIEKLLNDMLQRRIRFLTERTKEDPERTYYLKLRKEKLIEYENYFQPTKEWFSVMDTYRKFLMNYAQANGYDASITMQRLTAGKLDVYDCACMALIRRYLTEREKTESYGQIIIDEAQDFGEGIYYILKTLQPGCYFTIMGDVSQNIHYDTGMNDWTPLVEKVFNTDRDDFRTLQKSYRNTIEISEYAGRVLEKASAAQYRIDPVIRHGKPVNERMLAESQMLPYAYQVLKETVQTGHKSAAIVCRTALEAEYVEESLRKMDMDLMDSEQCQIMVLPIELVKGLEFDAVLIWNADEDHYPEDPRNAKLLYVAITRALHELHLLSTKSMTKLLR